MARKKIEHVGIIVSDLQKSIPFYQEVVGLTLKDTLLHTNGIIRLAFLGFENSGETEVELIQGYEGEVAREGRVHHIAFTVDDIEEEFSRIQAFQVAALDPEITTLPNGSRYFFFQGPDGESIEFFQSTR